MIRSTPDLVPTILPIARKDEGANGSSGLKSLQVASSPVVVTKYRVVPAGASSGYHKNSRIFFFLPSHEAATAPDKLTPEPDILGTPTNTTGKVKISASVGRALQQRAKYSGHYYHQDIDSSGSNGHGAPFMGVQIPDEAAEEVRYVILSRRVGDGESKPQVQEEAPSASVQLRHGELEISVLAEVPCTLRFERAEGAKKGRSISSVWQSEFDSTKVRFRKNYIDGDDDDDADNALGRETDVAEGGAKGKEKASRKRPLTLLETYKKLQEESGALEGEGGEPEVKKDSKLVAADAERKKRLRIEEPGKAVVSSDAGPVAPGNEEQRSLSSLPVGPAESRQSAQVSTPEAAGDVAFETRKALAEWKTSGLDRISFAEAAKHIMKRLSEYPAMKEKHQRPEEKAIAVEWFRTTQARVRQEVVRNGYEIDGQASILLQR